MPTSVGLDEVIDAGQDLDLELWLAEQELKDFPCSGLRHVHGDSHHVASDPGEFVLVAPCCGDVALLCRSRASYLRFYAADIHCNTCDGYASYSDYKFLPLPGVLPL